MDKIIKTIYNAIGDKKGENIRVFDISELTVISDYFVIASGNNENQVKAIADNITEQLLKEHNITPRQIEGYNSANWILLDYSNYVIHIFDKEQRSFYNLEKIWCDGKELDCKNDI